MKKVLRKIWIAFWGSPEVWQQNREKYGELSMQFLPVKMLFKRIIGR